VKTGYTWDYGWQTNTAGFKFQNWYGFGKLDLDAAITMALSYTSNWGVMKETKSSSNQWYYSATPASTIPNYDATGVTSTISVKHNFVIEAVQVKLSATHANAGELAVELTSPGSTKSIMLNANNSLDGNANLNNPVLLSNRFYGESSAGTWTLRVVDPSNITNGDGTLNNWSINIIGHVDPSPADTTAPAAVTGAMVAQTPYASSTQSPSFSFTASAAGDVLRYEYSIGSSSGGTQLKEWTPLGTSVSGQATGLSLSDNTTYYINIRTIDTSENVSSVVTTSWVADF
jgi:subtilisin-like proprotein convertase family protein